LPFAFVLAWDIIGARHSSAGLFCMRDFDGRRCSGCGPFLWLALLLYASRRNPTCQSGVPRTRGRKRFCICCCMTRFWQTRYG